MITHLEPDILEYEVKWALGGITEKKASRGDEILAQLFKIIKEDAFKVLHTQYMGNSGKLSNGHRTEKG